MATGIKRLLDSTQTQEGNGEPHEIETEIYAKRRRVDYTEGIVSAVCNNLPRVATTMVEHGSKKHVASAMARVTGEPDALALLCSIADRLDRMPSLDKPLYKALRKGHIDAAAVLPRYCDGIDDVRGAVERLSDKDDGASVGYIVENVRPPTGTEQWQEWVAQLFNDAAMNDRLSVVEVLADLCATDCFEGLLLACGAKHDECGVFKAIWKRASPHLCIHDMAFQVGNTAAGDYLRQKIERVGWTCDADDCVNKRWGDAEEKEKETESDE